MALMFPRLARNFAKNGYYPTDEPTLERALNALAPAAGQVAIIDPCAGEGVAIAEAAHALGRDLVSAYAVEFDEERARHAEACRPLPAQRPDGYADQSAELRTDVAQSPMGICPGCRWQHWLPGTGPRQAGEAVLSARPAAFAVRWRARFHHSELHAGCRNGGLADTPFHRTAHLSCGRAAVQAGGDLRHRSRQRDLASDAKAIRNRLLQIGSGDIEAEELPVEWPFVPYSVPATQAEPEQFYRVTMEPEQFAAEVHRLQGLWPSLDTYLGASQQSLRPPAVPCLTGISPWRSQPVRFRVSCAPDPAR